MSIHQYDSNRQASPSAVNILQHCIADHLVGSQYLPGNNEFVIALTFISSSSLKTYQLGLYDFLTTDAQIFLRYGNLHAAAALGLLPTFFGYMLVQRYFITGLTAGAVKG